MMAAVSTRQSGAWGAASVRVVVRLVRRHCHLSARQMLHYHLAVRKLALEMLGRRNGDVLAVAIGVRLAVDSKSRTARGLWLS
jgi:hypothetical protein